MSASPDDRFDPYHVWLGIPPAEQPANYYRLLGIAPFEDDPAVIESAADRQMAHVRSFQSGRRAALSQRLLNEIVTAKLCLLKRDQKAAYDRQLRSDATPTAEGESVRRLDALVRPAGHPKHGTDEGVHPTHSSNDIHDPVDATSPDDVTFVASVPSAVNELHTRPQGKAVSAPWLTAAIAAAFVVVVGVIAVATLNRATPEPAAEEKSAAQSALSPPGNPTLQSDAAASPPSPDPSEPSAADHAAAGFDPAELEAKEDDITSTPAAAGTEPISSPELSLFDEPDVVAAANHATTVRPEDEASPFDEPSAVGDEPSAEPAEARPARRLPVPDREAQREVLLGLKQIYALDEVETPSQQLSLARRLYDAGRDPRTDATERYVLLRAAAGLAGDALRLELMLRIIDAVAEGFSVDAFAVKVDALKSAGKAARTQAQIETLVDSTQQVIDEATGAERFDAALELCELATAVCRRPQGIPLRRRAAETLGQVRELAQQHARVRQALERLADAPDDAAAHLLVGRWHVARGDWQPGLLHLSQGSDAQLRRVALRDLAEPVTTAEQATLADEWWQAAEQSAGNEAVLFKLRAGHWYDRAGNRAFSGLAAVRAQKRRDEIAELRRTHDAELIK